MSNLQNIRLTKVLDAWLARGTGEGAMIQEFAPSRGIRNSGPPNGQVRMTTPQSEVQKILDRGLVLDRGDRSFTLRADEAKQLIWLTATYKRRGATPRIFGGPDATLKARAAIAASLTFACLARLDLPRACDLSTGIKVREVKWPDAGQRELAARP